MSANVLIANRGEIACRVIRSARRLGMRAIVLHTPADRGALFTRMANEAIKPLGASLDLTGFSRADRSAARASRRSAPPAFRQPRTRTENLFQETDFPKKPELCR